MLPECCTSKNDPYETAIIWRQDGYSDEDVTPMWEHQKPVIEKVRKQFNIDSNICLFPIGQGSYGYDVIFGNWYAMRSNGEMVSPHSIVEDREDEVIGVVPAKLRKEIEKVSGGSMQTGWFEKDEEDYWFNEAETFNASIKDRMQPKIKRLKIDAETRRMIGEHLTSNIAYLFYDIMNGAVKNGKVAPTQKAFVGYIRECMNEDWPIDVDIGVMRDLLIDEGYSARNWSDAEIVVALWPEVTRQTMREAKSQAPEIIEWVKTQNHAETFNAQIDGEKLMVGGYDFDDGSMMVGVGTEDIGSQDPDFMEMMIDKDGKIKYFTMPMGGNDYQRLYKPKPAHYGKMKTQNETNESAGGDFIRIDGDGKHAETFGVETYDEKGMRILDIEDFNKVADAIQATGQPVTVLFNDKGGRTPSKEITIIVGMDAPNSITNAMWGVMEDLGYRGYYYSICGNTTVLERREYSEIRRVNGGHKHYRAETFEAKDGDGKHAETFNADSETRLCGCAIPRPRHAGVHPTVCQSCDGIIEDDFEAEETLKRDSCCCGATKSNPCACMIEGVMECSGSCPCALERKGGESFAADEGCQDCKESFRMPLFDILGNVAILESQWMGDANNEDTYFFTLKDCVVGSQGENWLKKATPKLQSIMKDYNLQGTLELGNGHHIWIIPFERNAESFSAERKKKKSGCLHFKYGKHCWAYSGNGAICVDCGLTTYIDEDGKKSYGTRSIPFKGNYDAHQSESFSANPQGRARCSKCEYRYGMKTCGACGDIQCERCFGSSGWCKSCPPKCAWCNTPAHSCSNCSEPNYLCVDCCGELNAESFNAEHPDTGELLACPHCEKEVDWLETKASVTVHCPHCRTQIGSDDGHYMEDIGGKWGTDDSQLYEIETKIEQERDRMSFGKSAETFNADAPNWQVLTPTVISCDGACSMQMLYCKKCDEWFCEKCDDDHEAESHAESFSAEGDFKKGMQMGAGAIVGIMGVQLIIGGLLYGALSLLGKDELI